MTRNRPRVRPHRVRRHPLLAATAVGRMLAAGCLVIGVQGCDLKGSSFFDPVFVGGGGGGTELTAADIRGTWNVSYSTTQTTCEASLPPFEVDAAMSTTGTGSSVTLDVLFPDAPVPIRGTIELPGGDFSGTTGPVDIGGGFFATETWDATFSMSTTDDVVFSGTSQVDVEDDGGTPVCGRDFIIDGIRIGF